MSVEARFFVRELQKAVNDALRGEQDVRKLWDNSTKWTEFMLGSGETRQKKDFGIFGRIGQSLGYIPQAEYMRVDQIWYHVPGNDPSDWIIDAFIESENAPARLEETLRKLLHLGSGLKVAVLYLEQESPNKFVERAGALIRGRHGVAPDARILLVLGSLKDSKVSFQGFAFDGLGRHVSMSAIST